MFTHVITGISDSGCSGNDTITVNVLEHSECTIPNAFSPNDDGHNHYLEPVSALGAKPLSLKVYNRMGLLLYSGSGSSFMSREGKYNGHQQEMGTYLYILTYLLNEGITRTKKGNVTLIKKLFEIFLDKGSYHLHGLIGSLPIFSLRIEQACYILTVFSHSNVLGLASRAYNH